ncbi:hypothetical protein KSC_013850 [Ktedonobacter sp. SOSP1-52]|uniref:hypothetical protein n=1 Tax=Ktedonobacter sp. SOSP1-52 TaxID=2778366 RepID=UPI001914EE47|nr:hypothetical protein [Ktedonobacter sp. SOSP1-52]GHO62493.1 hypothetical protein KSC_013850 [Ktedonobacter sp. SOSP1-52]
MVSPKLPELAGVIVEASAWSLVVFTCPDSPFSQGSVPPPEREQAELGAAPAARIYKNAPHMLACGVA